MTDMNRSTHRVAWVSVYHPHSPSSPKNRASCGFKNVSEEDLYGEQPGSPGDVEIVISGSGGDVLGTTPEGETIEAVHPSRFRLKRPAYTYQSGRYEEDVQEYCEC